MEGLGRSTQKTKTKNFKELVIMKTLDKRKKYIMVIDTETAGAITAPLVYDLGIAITDRKGKIYETHSLIISDIYDVHWLMSTAYYKDKITTHYTPGIESGKFKKVKFNEALELMRELSHKYNIKQLSAYNIDFDIRALNNTAQTVLKYDLDFSHYDIVCIQKLAISQICTQKGYARFCLEHGLTTAKGYISTKAEDVYRYLLNCPTYIEEHTGLSDVLIEIQIMERAYRQNKKNYDTKNYQFLNKFHEIPVVE